MFEFLVSIFDFFLYRPLFNFLILIYDLLPGHDFGLAIILLTFFVKLVLYPLSVKALHSQRALQALQPKLKEIQKKYKDDKEKQAQETLELYKSQKINPFSGFILIIIQLPILIALYRVFRQGLQPQELSKLYAFVANPIHVNPLFLHAVDLTQSSWWLAILAGIVQFFQVKMLQPNLKGKAAKDDISAVMQKQMMYFLPIITVVILYKLPSALGLYWMASGLFAIGQQYLFLKKQPMGQPVKHD